MIPLSKPHIKQDDIRAVVDVLKSGQLSMGPRTDDFEKQFATRLGVSHAIAVNSGTSGLHLALRASSIREGDEVITTPFSFVASANCILFEKAKPVFVDVDEATFNLDPTLVEKAITSKTKAILPVHIFGQSCEMQPLLDLAEKHHLSIIEDACEALDATHHGKKVGTFGAAAVFAFYPNKQMTTGEGGMIVTTDDTLAALCRSMRNQGRGEDRQWLHHERLGYNYRMTEMSAALGCTQLAKLDMLSKKRAQIVKKYIKQLKAVSGIILPTVLLHNTHTWFVFPVRVTDGISRDAVITALAARGVASKAYFSPCIHLQPFYRDQFGFKEGDFPVAEKLSRTTFILPLYVSMTEKDIKTVVDAVREALAVVQQAQRSSVEL